jgi:DNA-binding XRE family transcriptional regulator
MACACVRDKRAGEASRRLAEEKAMTDEEKKELSRRISLRIKARREELGLKQSAVADLIKMSRPSFNRIETEARDVPSLVTLFRIAKGLQCRVADLVRGVDEEAVPPAPPVVVEAPAVPATTPTVTVASPTE